MVALLRPVGASPEAMVRRPIRFASAMISVLSAQSTTHSVTERFWIALALAIPVLILMPLFLLRPVKGFLLCQQWKTKAREGQVHK